MRQHLWILSLLEDLESYAKLNDLPQVQNRIAAARATAKEEIIIRAARTADDMSTKQAAEVVPLRSCGSE